MQIRLKSLKINANLKFVILFMFSIGFLHFKSFNQLPTKIHAWAQADHYAVALHFMHKDVSFFKPESFSLTHQFPPEKVLENPKGITAMDFPILHYSIGKIMKLTGSKSPFIYRFFMMLLSFFSLFFLFRTLNQLRGYWEAIFICGFILFQPIYVYYQNGFHVSMAAFNVLLIGIVFLIKYLHLKEQKLYLFGVFFLILAALMRFTQIIFLISLLGLHFFDSIKNKKISRKIVLPILGFCLVILYFFYNKTIGKHFGSLFLNEPLLATSLEQLFKHFFNQLKTYAKGFLPIMHLALFVGLYIMYRKNKTENKKDLKPLLYGLIIATIGVILFNFLMSSSLAVHDYYSLDTWTPLLIMALIYMMLQLHFDVILNKKRIVIIALSVLLCIASIIQYSKYTAQDNNADILIADFKESANFLNKHSIEKDKIVIIAYEGWNTPMIGWQKKVHRVAAAFDITVPLIFQENFDLIITHNQSYEEKVSSRMTNFTDFVDKIADNGKVTIWKPKK